MLNMTPGTSAKAAAEGAFYAARMKLWAQVEAALTTAELPPFAAVHTQQDGVRYAAGWRLTSGSGRGLWVRFQPAALATPVTPADLAPHQAVLEAAGLRCKPRELDGHPALLVLPEEEAL